jgi:hypothetical protein
MAETPFVVGYPELVTAVILLSLKRAVSEAGHTCWRPDEALVTVG